mmetsp:Transcript_12721/g.35953  ORF Transcript_12721/g.35953 Transcript_12721/m.35953 type:complete len:345 (+) Transcript_12721:262-1296(+)
MVDGGFLAPGCGAAAAAPLPPLSACSRSQKDSSGCSLPIWPVAAATWAGGAPAPPHAEPGAGPPCLPARLLLSNPPHTVRPPAPGRRPWAARLRSSCSRSCRSASSRVMAARAGTAWTPHALGRPVPARGAGVRPWRPSSPGHTTGAACAAPPPVFQGLPRRDRPAASASAACCCACSERCLSSCSRRSASSISRREGPAPDCPPLFLSQGPRCASCRRLSSATRCRRRSSSARRFCSCSCRSSIASISLRLWVCGTTWAAGISPTTSARGCTCGMTAWWRAGGRCAFSYLCARASSAWWTFPFPANGVDPGGLTGAVAPTIPGTSGLLLPFRCLRFFFLADLL